MKNPSQHVTFPNYARIVFTRAYRNSINDILIELVAVIVSVVLPAKLTGDTTTTIITASGVIVVVFFIQIPRAAWQEYKAVAPNTTRLNMAINQLNNIHKECVESRTNAEYTKDDLYQIYRVNDEKIRKILTQNAINKKYAPNLVSGGPPSLRVHYVT